MLPLNLIQAPWRGWIWTVYSPASNLPVNIFSLLIVAHMWLLFLVHLSTGFCVALWPTESDFVLQCSADRQARHIWAGISVFCIYIAYPALLIFLPHPFTLVSDLQSHTHTHKTHFIVLAALFYSFNSISIFVSSLSLTNWELICSLVRFCPYPFLFSLLLCC